MERMNLNYSTKNIPIPSQKHYLKRLLEKTELLIRRMRWVAFFFLYPNENASAKETFGFKTTKVPPAIPEMKQFEDKMLNLIKNVRFRNPRNQFQQELAKDVKMIQKEKKVIVAADKTTNFYKMQPSEYNTLLRNNITKDYKTAHHATIRSIKREEKEIAEKLELDDRMEVMAQKEAFITLKDHKDNFRNRPTCRLINPCKPETGIVSKAFLDRINETIRVSTQVNQWKNSDSVISWFKDIENKNLYHFISFDIVNFYPSITEGLLDKAIDFASNFTNITNKEIRIIKHAKKSLLYNGEKPWVKKDNNNRTRNFDVTMGSYDGAETCDLVGLFLLNELTTKFGNNIGLYRDDGLAVFKSSKQETERIKKEIQKIFQDYELNITIEANKKIVDFLDVTFNLQDGTFSPYMKPGNTPSYVHSLSNHPPSVLKNIPEAVNKRLSNISSNDEIFNTAAPPYQEALRKSGYNHQLQYNQTTSNITRRNRRRKVTWYNPPYNMNVETNIGHKFLKIINESFPSGHKLARAFNRQTLKLSYSCMPNMKAIIDGHNKSINNAAEPPEEDGNEGCNCQANRVCPMPGRCKASNVVYQAVVTTEDNQPPRTYVGITSTTFKERFRNHDVSFNDERKKYSTELSKHIWDLKANDIRYSITWKVLEKRKPYSNISKRCGLCLEEKYIIIFKPELACLNKRDTIVSTCRHRRKFLIAS